MDSRYVDRVTNWDSLDQLQQSMKYLSEDFFSVSLRNWFGVIQ